MNVLPETYSLVSRRERMLLVLIGVFLAVNSLALSIARPDALVTHWLPFLGWIGCAVVGNNLLNRHLPARDALLFPLVMLLSGWGLVVIDRLAPNFADRQGVWLILSVTAMLIVAIFPHALHWLRNYRYILLVIGLTLLVSTILLGQNPSGLAGAPQLWLGISLNTPPTGTADSLTQTNWGIFFQPSEALKIILVAFLASYLGEQAPALRAAGLKPSDQPFSLSPRIVGPILLMWGLSVVILIWQRDLGTAILFFLVFLILLYVASGYTRILLSGALLVIVAAVVAYYLFSVVQLRIDIWLNPWPEADGRAYQIVQSLLAFASGSVFGQGITQGSPTYIPVVHSDFVFAALAEEWGLLGAITIIAGLALYVMRGLRIAVQQRVPFYALLAVGLSTVIGIQSLLIMGGVLKVFPLTGVTLPFISYGGSSLLMSFIITGLLLRLSAGER